MKKLPLWISLLALAIIILGTQFAANNPIFWMATSTPSYQYARLLVAIVITLQLMTTPPRHMAFRIFAGLFAFFVGGWAIQQSYVYHMAFLDSAAIVGSCITIFATALEVNTSGEPGKVATAKS